MERVSFLFPGKIGLIQFRVASLGTRAATPEGVTYVLLARAKTFAGGAVFECVNSSSRIVPANV